MKLKEACFIITTLSLNLFHYLKRQFLHKIFGKPITKPWMKDKEIILVKEILLNLQPQRCLEWGAGFSTLYFSNLLPKKAAWISLETNLSWFNKIQRLNQNPKVKILYLKPHHLLKYPSRLEKFDFIFIDGQQRRTCFKKSLDLIKKNGLVILHDANRKIYSKYFKLFKHQLIFKDQRLNQGGLFLGSKSLNISTLSYLQKHQKLWQIYDWLS